MTPPFTGNKPSLAESRQYADVAQMARAEILRVAGSSPAIGTAGSTPQLPVFHFPPYRESANQLPVYMPPFDLPGSNPGCGTPFVYINKPQPVSSGSTPLAPVQFWQGFTCHFLPHEAESGTTEERSRLQTG